ncbi:MAG: hypothetical protein HGB29_06605 [Chlorobiaceae bacterium]|nr:hypothetical protein [Chlorobiaceae bacterium]
MNGRSADRRQTEKLDAWPSGTLTRLLSDWNPNQVSTKPMSLPEPSRSTHFKAAHIARQGEKESSRSFSGVPVKVPEVLSRPVYGVFPIDVVNERLGDVIRVYFF